MSFFSALKRFISAYKKEKKNETKRSNSQSGYTVTIREDDDVMREINEEFLKEAIENGNEEDIRYYSRKLDTEYQRAHMDYLSNNVRIAEMRVDQRVSKEEFERACQEHMMRAYAFKSLYEKYSNQPFSTDIFKIYAIFLEREGRYVDAATVCARALRWGFPNDRTQGGMRGRLLRLVKKAGGEVNEEIEDALKKYCQ